MKFRKNLIEIIKQGKVVVHCDTEEKAMVLLEELDKCGVCWCGGMRIGSYTYWDYDEEDTCYHIDDDSLVHSSKDFYMRHNYRIIEFEELLEEQNNNDGLMPKINDITDRLESEAEMECSAAIKQAEAYKEGYIAACEVFRRKVRDILQGVDVEWKLFNIPLWEKWEKWKEEIKQNDEAEKMRREEKKEEE